MIEEYKELLLKDLCCRLPYGVKCAYYNTKDEIKVGELLTIWCKEKRVFIDKLSIDYDGGDHIGVIPCLFPLSSMTDELKEEYQCLLDNQYSFDANGNIFTFQDFYCKYHLDYRGLIPMGLAIDATGKNIY